MKVGLKYTKVEGKDKTVYEVVKVDNDQQATWVTVKSKKGTTSTYGSKTFKAKFEKIK